MFLSIEEEEAYRKTIHHLLQGKFKTNLLIIIMPIKKISQLIKIKVKVKDVKAWTNWI